jgi:hypothetical protein
MLSALPPILAVKADIRDRQVRATSGLMHRNKTQTLFDHLIGAAEQRRWHGEAERLSGRQIDR